MIEIMENAIIEYSDGVKEQFDAIYLTNKRAITGRIFNIEGEEKFIQNGFVPRKNIKNIYNGSKRKVQKMES